jgi:hypothetical protein
MAKRKQTPDVLAEILGGGAAGPGPSAPAPVEPARKAQAISQPAAPQPALKPPASRPKAAPAPAAWCYQVVSFQDYHGWRPRFIDGRELSDWMNGPLLHEYLAGQAEAGWELAAATAGEPLYARADSRQLFFKRPRIAR